MTSQGSARARFGRFLKQRNLFAVETAIREMGTVSLLDALDNLELLTDVKPGKLERAALLVSPAWRGMDGGNKKPA